MLQDASVIPLPKHQRALSYEVPSRKMQASTLMWTNGHGKMFWFDQELEDLETEHKAASDLFEKQKEEAMATMKKSEDLKSLRLAKSQTRCKLVPQSTFFEMEKKTSARKWNYFEMNFLIDCCDILQISTGLI